MAAERARSLTSDGCLNRWRQQRLYARNLSGYAQDATDVASVSDAALAFIQRCQVSALAWPTGTSWKSPASIWGCCVDTPQWTALADCGAVSSALLRLGIQLHRSECRVACAAETSDAVTDCSVAKRFIVVARMCYRDPALTLGSIARTLGVSKCYLSRVITSETGYHYPTHINGLRLFHAALLLRSTRQSIKEVSATVGYSRTAELDRHCTKWFGMTPTVFRYAVPFGAEDSPRIRTSMLSLFESATPRLSEIADRLRADLGVVLRLYLECVHAEDGMPHAPILIK